MSDYIILFPIAISVLCAYLIGCIQGYAKGAEDATKIFIGK